MDNALNSHRMNQAVNRSRRMFRRTLVGWAGDYLRFQADDGRRCRWTGGRRPSDEPCSPAGLIVDPPADG